MRGSILIAIASSIVLLAASEGAARSHTGAIDVHGSAQVSGDRITLSDLGRLTGDALEFEDVDLGHAPDAGSVRRLTGAAILERLRNAGLDEESIRYRIPAAVRVRRAHQEVDPEDLRRAIHAHMADWLPHGDEVESIELPARMRVPLGEYFIRVSAPEAVSRHGHEAQLEVEQDGRVVARAPARLRIASRGTVVVARRPISRGAVVRAADVRLEERSLRSLPSTILRELDEVVGQHARVAISPGRVVTARQIEAPTLVEKGDRVRVAIETAGMRLTVPAEALDSAGLGQRVRLVNRSSGREFTAEVIAHGKARVHY